METLRSSYDLTPGIESRLRACLASTGRLVERANGTWIKRTYKDGVIWFAKDYPDKVKTFRTLQILLFDLKFLYQTDI